MCAVALIGFADFAHSEATGTLAQPTGLRGSFPTELGNYRLTRSWTEQLDTGSVVYYWAEYSAANGSSPVDVGISPLFHWHDPIICHTARAEYPIWQGPLTLRTGASATDFAAALYSDGISQRLELSTQCAGGACGEHATEQRHFGLIYARVSPGSNTGSRGSVPIIVRTEAPLASLPADAARQQLTRALQSFLAGADLAELARP